MPTPSLEMRGISKRFPGVLANDRVDFDLRVGDRADDDRPALDENLALVGLVDAAEYLHQR